MQTSRYPRLKPATWSFRPLHSHHPRQAIGSPASVRTVCENHRVPDAVPLRQLYRSTGLPQVRSLHRCNRGMRKEIDFIPGKNCTRAALEAQVVRESRRGDRRGVRLERDCSLRRLSTSCLSKGSIRPLDDDSLRRGIFSVSGPDVESSTELRYVLRAVFTMELATEVGCILLGKDSQTLLMRAAGGETSAISRLYELYQLRLQRMASVRLDRRLKSRVDPCDIVQDAFVMALSSFADYSAKKPVPVNYWLRGLVRRCLSRVRERHIRAERRSVLRELPYGQRFEPGSPVDRLVDRALSPERYCIQSEDSAEIQFALKKISAPQRQLLYFRYYEQASLSKIAIQMQITTGAARVRLNRALQKLESAVQIKTCGAPKVSEPKIVRHRGTNQEPSEQRTG